METRIGVFLCNCGGGMKNIDFDAVAARVTEMPGVACVNLSSNLCSKAGREQMVSRIKEENIDRVVVAACSPEFEEHVLWRALEDAGLNEHLLSMANIREQCSWAHEGDVTAKAVELVRMAVNGGRLLHPVEKKDLPVERGVLVVGGGFSAFSTALRLSSTGVCTTLLVDAGTAGGGDQELDSLCRLDMSSMVAAAERDENIEMINSARIVAVRGTMGDFIVTMSRNGENRCRKFGAIVLATGFRTGSALAPITGTKGEAVSGMNIVSQEQLRDMLGAPLSGTKPDAIGFVFDFVDDSSRFSTLASLSNALAARRAWGSEVYVFCKDVKVDSQGAERLYREARDCGVVFVKCSGPPKVSTDNERIAVEARDVLLGEDAVVNCELLVAEELLFPSEGTRLLGSLLGVRLDARGFYQDENVHLYPVASEKRGLFFVGECRGQSDVGRLLADISCAVVSIQELLSAGTIAVEIERVKADPQKCVACLTCIRVCPHGAIQLMGTDGGKEVAAISDLACYACGICVAICPAKAIEFQDYRDDQMLAQIEALGEG
ncbi:MAG: CoB--CoM heterodisulfide reductase iron-sulfur subunit A family protein [Dehalococcoidia bacterium]|nr:CoB--CoM heterodisulfide reductase iron-sulfur subunit A family protein [Dehalococcoidia bacterium]